jgi:hypothetical protein
MSELCTNCGCTTEENTLAPIAVFVVTMSIRKGIGELGVGRGWACAWHAMSVILVIDVTFLFN